MPYVAVTVRIPSQILLQAREFAKTSGWELADFLRTLISIGAAFFFLSYGSQAGQEAASTLLGGVKLLTLSKSFSLHFSQRPYALRIPGRKSTLATLSLPQSVCELMAAYAGLMDASRNQVYSKCLHEGLLIYLKAQSTILAASQK